MWWCGFQGIKILSRVIAWQLKKNISASVFARLTPSWRRNCVPTSHLISRLSSTQGWFMRSCLPGWRLRPLWHLHHPTVHSSELVWNLLQVRLKRRGRPPTLQYMRRVANRPPSGRSENASSRSVWLIYCWCLLCRLIQSSFVDMENMLALFTEQSEVSLKYAA